jgi:hypothetical protein
MRCWRCCHEFERVTGLGADRCLSLDRGYDALYEVGAALGGTYWGPVIRSPLPRRIIWIRAFQSTNSGDTY